MVYVDERFVFFFFSSRRRHTRLQGDWSSDVCSSDLTAVEQRSAVKAYQREVQSQDIVSRRVGEKTKSGVFIGSYARQPAKGEAIPIWIADYVLLAYGTGALIADPAHDKRDFPFTTPFQLPIRHVL